MTSIVLVGEAWGKDEAEAKRPFVGASGQLLDSMLNAAGLKRAECHITNVFNFRPEKNDLLTLCGPKYPGCPPAIRPGKYLLPEHAGNLDMLQHEIRALAPNVVVCLGATPTWAALQRTIKISEIRGTAMWSDFFNCKIVPTFHPAAVLRQWNFRPTVIMDLMKAARESKSKALDFLDREIWIEPELADLYRFEALYINAASKITIDIETPSGQIDCVGFATDKLHAIVVPFVDKRKPNNSYWPTESHETAAWNWVRKICRNPLPKCGQNFLYDIQWLWRKMGITINNFRHDTMLKSHALYPELPKSLGFLGSIYCNERAWKLLGKYRTEDKRDE